MYNNKKNLEKLINIYKWILSFKFINGNLNRIELQAFSKFKDTNDAIKATSKII